MTWDGYRGQKGEMVSTVRTKRDIWTAQIGLALRAETFLDQESHGLRGERAAAGAMAVEHSWALYTAITRLLAAQRPWNGRGRSAWRAARTASAALEPLLRLRPSWAEHVKATAVVPPGSDRETYLSMCREFPDTGTLAGWVEAEAAAAYAEAAVAPLLELRRALSAAPGRTLRTGLVAS